MLMIVLWLVSYLAGLVKSGLVRLQDFVPNCIKGLRTGIGSQTFTAY
jgi:hypothetical protein